MKWLVFLLMLVYGFAGAQDTVKPFVFSISENPIEVDIKSRDTILWIDEANKIDISVSGDAEFATATLKGGTLKMKGKDLYAFVDKGTSALLSVYVRDVDDSVKLAKSKKFTIKERPDPEAFVCGVRTDSVLEKTELLDEAVVFAIQRKPQRMILLVTSFELAYYDKINKEMDTLRSNSSFLTLQMTRVIHRSKPGDVLTFTNIQCLKPTGKIEEVEPVRIFLINTPGFKEKYPRM